MIGMYIQRLFLGFITPWLDANENVFDSFPFCRSASPAANSNHDQAMKVKRVLAYQGGKLETILLPMLVTNIFLKVSKGAP